MDERGYGTELETEDYNVHLGERGKKTKRKTSFPLISFYVFTISI